MYNVIMMTYQLTVVCSQVIGVGVGEEQQLGVGVDGEVSLDDGLVLADEVSNMLDLDLRLGSVPTVGLAAGAAGGSQGCNENYGGKYGGKPLMDMFFTFSNAL